MKQAKGESKKVPPLRLLHYIYAYGRSLLGKKFSQLFAIHIFTYKPILVLLSQYL